MTEGTEASNKMGSDSQPVLQPTPRRESVNVALIENLAQTNANVERHLKLAEHLAWLYDSGTVVRKEQHSSDKENSSFYVQFLKKRLLKRASTDFGPQR